MDQPKELTFLRFFDSVIGFYLAIKVNFLSHIAQISYQNALTSLASQRSGSFF